jgi:hypothetical protein
LLFCFCNARSRAHASSACFSRSFVQVRNFVAFNKGLTFRTALRTLLEIGYQARPQHTHCFVCAELC